MQSGDRQYRLSRIEGDRGGSPVKRTAAATPPSRRHPPARANRGACPGAKSGA